LLHALFGDAAAGGVISPELYLAFLTMHGTLMIFFVLTVAPQHGFGNHFLPLQLGANEMAWPKLGAVSLGLAWLSFLVALAAFFVAGGAPTAGWTAYPTLSAVGAELNVPGLGAGMNVWLVSIALFCVASVLGALNFILTILTKRAKDLPLMEMPLTCWGWFTSATVSLVVFPVLLAACLLLLADRNLGTAFFVPVGLSGGEGALARAGGGSPLLWQHLFWFFGHPEVYIAILPGMGVVSHVLAKFANKPVFGYRAMVYSLSAIGLLGLLVWGHHMFTSGLNPSLALAFSALTLVIGVPSAVKTFNWLATLWGGRLSLTTPMLFATGFVSVFVTGGLTGLILGQAALDVPLHDTYFVIAHFHLVMGVAAIFALLAATYYWFPQIYGRRMNETLGRLHFALTFAGVYAVFVPMHLLGLMGMPRRYAQFTEAGAPIYSFLAHAPPLMLFITIAAFVTATAQLLFLGNFFWSIFKGESASANTWETTPE
jgi:cytochrome c oxidase subunit 1